MAGLDWLTARPFAHRGLHNAALGAVENTVTAFWRAIDGGFAIGTDLQITSDGEAVVFHDATLKRLAERDGRLSAMTAAALKGVALKQTGDRIITLGDLFDLVDGRVTLLLELKSLRDGDTRLPQRVAEVLRGYSGPVAAMSFDPAQMLALRAAAPGLPCGITAGGWRPGEHRRILARQNKTPAAYLSEIVRMRPQFLAYAVEDLTGKLPWVVRNVLRRPLLTWTVHTAAERALAARLADQMIFEGFRP
jgi:glycerophosphoryl diester phosphodiesterase